MKPENRPFIDVFSLVCVHIYAPKLDFKQVIRLKNLFFNLFLPLIKKSNVDEGMPWFIQTHY